MDEGDRLMTHNLRFATGDLLTVIDNFKHIGNGAYASGPAVRGHTTAQLRDFKPGNVFLALSDAKESSWRHSRRLYLEVMTPTGPRMAWARCFKMKKVEDTKGQ